MIASTWVPASCSSSSRFAASSTAEEAHAGDIAARPVEAGDEANSDRVGADREHDRNRRGGGFRGKRRSVARCDDHCHLAADQIGRQRWQPIVLILRPAVFDRDVLTFDIAGLLQALTECGHTKARAAAGGPPLRKPITGIAGCCARAASGHAAAPPSSVMNSRRFTRSPRRRAGSVRAVFRARAPSPF